MGKESIVDIKGNKYRYEYSDGQTRYVGPVGSSAAMTEEDFMRRTMRLNRTFNGETFMLSEIKDRKEEAEAAARELRLDGFKSRVVQVKPEGRVDYAVYRGPRRAKYPKPPKAGKIPKEGIPPIQADIFVSLQSEELIGSSLPSSARSHIKPEVGPLDRQTISYIARLTDNNYDLTKQALQSLKSRGLINVRREHRVKGTRGMPPKGYQ